MSAPKKLSDKVPVLNFEFYRDGYRRLLNIVIAMLVLNMVVIWVIIYYVAHQPVPRFFSTSTDGQIVQLYPLNQPFYSDDEVMEWAGTASAKSFELDYTKLKKQMTDMKVSFTPTGWRSYSSNMSNIIDAVGQRKIAVVIQGVGMPSIKSQGAADGRYTWVVSTPIMVEVKNLANSSVDKKIFNTNVIVRRISLANNSKGLGIVDFSVESRDA